MKSFIHENHEKWQTVTPVPFCIGFDYANLLKSILKCQIFIKGKVSLKVLFAIQ